MKVLSKQRNSKMCYICGMENPEGMKAQFYNMEDGSVIAPFKYRVEHQSFPKRVHGGLISTMLDELAFRAYWAIDENAFGVTTSMSIKFRKPVPYDTDLFARGIVYKDSSKFFKTYSYILDKDGTILAEADTSYIKLLPDKIVEHVDVHEEMKYLIQDNVKELEINL